MFNALLKTYLGRKEHKSPVFVNKNSSHEKTEKPLYTYDKHTSDNSVA
nr:hypothetical protein BSM_20830 [uncultured archaeon]